MAAVTQEKPAKSRPKLDARAAMESLNQEAGKFNIWLRTQANSPAQRPWFRDTGMEAAGQLAGGRVGSAQVKAAAHRWRWKEIGPYLDRIAEIAKQTGAKVVVQHSEEEFDSLPKFPAFMD